MTGIGGGPGHFQLMSTEQEVKDTDLTAVQGNLFYTEEYPGCPFCGTKNFVMCNKCHKISCWNGESRLECPWCGNDMNNIVTATEKFNLSGGDI